MRFLKKITWANVFDVWRRHEGSNPDWVKLAIEVKGWPDWESWRTFSVSQIMADKREWSVYEFNQPHQEIPRMLVGPYSGWQHRHPQTNAFTFADLVKVKAEFDYWNQNPKIKSLISHFPSDTQFIGLQKEDGTIICLEGHHRATAIALACEKGEPVAIMLNPRIALSQIKNDELHLIDAMLKRGSTKQP